MLPNVTYNRSQREYTVIDPQGEIIATHPAGRDGRQAAFQDAVKAQNIRLYRQAAALSDAHPQLASRIWRACEIMLSGEIICPDSGNVLAIVPSQSSEYGGYNIVNVAGLLACDCEDFQGGTAVYTDADEQPRCKHILAFELATALKTRQCLYL